MPAEEAIVVSHTHWDREWYMPFQEYRMWLVELMDSLLKVFEDKHGFKCFTLDGQTSALEDYLEIRPEKLDKLKKLVSEGKILVGPWYTQPDEWLVSPESLVRNLLVGHRVGSQFGEVLKVGYVPDNFGHPCQIPQIFRGFGIDSFVFMRGMGDEGEKLKTEFIWRAPEGSKVIAVHLIEGYCAAALLGVPSTSWSSFIGLWEGPTAHLTYPRSFSEALDRVDPKASIDKVQQLRERLSPKSASGTLLFMNGCDHLPAQPGIVDAMEIVNERDIGIRLIHAGLQDYINRVRPVAEELQVYDGEMWGARFHHLLPGVLSTRMYLKQQNRKAEILLESYAEPLACYASLFGYAYPKKLLSLAWKLLLLNHAHDSIHGSSVDPVHAEMESRYHQAVQIANSVAHEALEYVGKRAKSLSADKGLRVVAYNPSSWTRSDIAKLWVDLPPGDYLAMGKDGRASPVQFLREDYVGFPRKTLSHVAFTAQDLPSTGYKEFAIVKAETVKSRVARRTIRVDSKNLENEFFHVEVQPTRGGAFTVTDKRSGAIYRGFNTFVDEGDHGDAWNYSPPKGGDMVISSPKEHAHTEIVEDGPVTVTLKISLALKTPRKAEGDRRSTETAELPITSYISLHSGVPRIDIKTKVDNTADDHRLRVVFATGLQTSVVNADGLFYVNNRPLRPVTKGEDWWELPPVTFPQSFWLEVDDGVRGVTIANEGLPEYECRQEDGVTIYLTLIRCIGSLGKVDVATRKRHIGLPAIPVPEAQCRRRHTFEYSVVPHSGDWAEGRSYRHAKSFVNPFVCWSTKDDGGELPLEERLIVLEPDNLIISAIKQAEEDDSTIVRFYEIMGKPVTAQIKANSRYCKAWLTNLNEENLRVLKLENGKMHVPVGAHEVVTIRLEVHQG